MTIQTDAMLFIEFLSTLWKVFGQIFFYAIVPVAILMIPFIKVQTRNVQSASRANNGG